jgi:hypothetical protein
MNKPSLRTKVVFENALQTILMNHQTYKHEFIDNYLCNGFILNTATNKR